MKKTYTPKQKASIALSALRGESLSKLGSLHQIHPVQIGKWKKTLESNAEQIFSDKRKKKITTKKGSLMNCIGLSDSGRWKSPG